MAIYLSLSNRMNMYGIHGKDFYLDCSKINRLETGKFAREEKIYHKAKHT